MHHPLLEPAASTAAAHIGLALGLLAYGVGAAVRLAAVADVFVPLSILEGVGAYPLRPFLGGDARIGLAILVLALLCTLPFIRLRYSFLVTAVSLLTFAACQFVSVVLPYLFLNGVIPIPDVLRTRLVDNYTHPWLRVIVFAALTPIALAALAFGAPRLLRRLRLPHGPA